MSADFLVSRNLELLFVINELNITCYAMITRSGISSGVYVGLVCYVCVLCYSLVSQYTNRMCSCT